MNGWAFLVARGRHKDYRTVLAPDFLVAHNLHGLLSESAGGDSPDPDGRHSAEIDNSEVGHISLTYKAEQVKAEDLDGNLDGDVNIVLDEHGRPLELLYGVVSRNWPPPGVDERDLQRARAEAFGSYRTFLAAEEAFRVNVSRSFRLHPAGTSSLLSEANAPARDALAAPKVLTPATMQGAKTSSFIRSGQRKVGTGAVVAIAGVGLVALLIFWFTSRPVLPANMAVCPAGHTLSGTIIADGPTAVNYHWEWETGRGREWRVVFAAAGENKKSVEVDVPMMPKGGVQAGRYSLVVDNLRELQQTVKAEAGCGGAQ